MTSTPLNLFSRSELELPHPHLSIGLLLVVEEAIRFAWQILIEDPPAGFDMVTEEEKTINHHLRETLQDHVWNRNLVDGFDAQQVACITSAEEVRDFSGRELQKKPDMIVKLVGMPTNAKASQYGVFIECKPVDKNHPPVGHYCRRGIKRFVNGRYAWAMQEAMMIGYVAGDDDPVQTLSVALAKCKECMLPIGDPEFCDLSVPPNAIPTAITRHSRSFSYVETGTKAPDIVLRHVWLRRTGIDNRCGQGGQGPADRGRPRTATHL